MGSLSRLQLSMKLLSKFAVAAALAAPFAIISPSSAQVACGPGNIADYLAYGSTGCISGDKIYSNFSFTGLPGTTALSVTDSGPQHTFSASGLNLNAGSSASYSYTVAIAPGNPGASFLAYRTGATTSDVFNPLLSTKSLTGTPNGLASNSVNDGTGNVVTYSPTIGGPVNFTGSMNVTGGRMDVITDTLVQQFNTPNSVPGPLPILGAAAAFGSVRKLRKFSSLVKQG
jgi:hypothetical protein